jgi:hypothetical protein
MSLLTVIASIGSSEPLLSVPAGFCPIMGIRWRTSHSGFPMLAPAHFFLPFPFHSSCNELNIFVLINGKRLNPSWKNTIQYWYDLKTYFMMYLMILILYYWCLHTRLFL